MREQWPRLRHYIAQLATGGSWADSFSRTIRQNLRWFWFDGLFSAASDSILLTYLVLYILALGASRTQIGTMSALTSLSAALMLLPGAMLAERWKRRKLITVIFGGTIARLFILSLIFLPFLYQNQSAVVIAIALSVSREAFANISLPAWVSLNADIVPLSWRGRYYASRNIIMGIAGMSITLLVGVLITHTSKLSGYQLALGLAFFLGMLSTYSFARIKEPSISIPVQPATGFSIKIINTDFRAHPGFLILCLTAALWNFSLNIAGPFFNVYLVQNLQSSASMVGFLSIISSLSGLFVQRVFGTLSDRWGPRQVQLITGLLIPILPLAWTLVRSPWHVIPINLMSGILWAGYSLASFNFLLTFTPEDQRARFTAVYQLIVTLALAAGAAIGGQIVTYWGYTAIFICSGVGRFSAALLFARFVPHSLITTRPIMDTVI